MRGAKDRILIIEDTHDILTWVGSTPLRDQYSIHSARDFQEAQIDLKHPQLRLVLLDLNFENVSRQQLLNPKSPHLEGLAILKQIRYRYPLHRVVMITAYPDPQTIRKAWDIGAIDYIEWDHLLADPTGSIEKIRAYIDLESLPEMKWFLKHLSPVPPFLRLFFQLKKFVQSGITFILVGFPGAPKDLIKSLIAHLSDTNVFSLDHPVSHRLSEALPEDSWLWVDHAEHIDPFLQEKILRMSMKKSLPSIWFFHHPPSLYLQQKKISSQILALPVINIPQISSLSAAERLEIFKHRLTVYGGDFSQFSSKARAFLEDYLWPGDWFHLDQAAHALSLKSKHNGGTIHLTDVVEILGHPQDWKDDPIVKAFLRNHTIDEIERIMIHLALEECPTKEEAARRLGISRATLYNKLREDTEKV
ncbi:MAG: response regulator [Candidatus Hydrothermae bacterium]|nr:response regulator [Candidatus Hydrothermae bacterium]